jgi:hypothetical protein
MEFKSYKKNPGDESCVAFGLYNGTNQNATSACLECKKLNKKLFNACIKSGKEFMGVNVAVGRGDKTFTTTKAINNTLKIKPRKERTKKMVPEQDKSKTDKDSDTYSWVSPPITKKKQVVRSGQTVGVLETAKKLLTEGKSYNEALGTLIGIYMAVLRDPKRSKHNAQSTVFNALKRLGLKKADNEKGYEKYERTTK